jgi:hypothetical protein
MTARVTPELRSRLQQYAKKLLEYSWDTSLILTLGFGAILLFMLVYGLAINYKLINPPPLFCHSMVGDKHVEGICK